MGVDARKLWAGGAASAVIAGLVTTITVAFPFGTTAALDAKIATAVVSLAIGVATGTLVGGVATRSVPGARFP